MAHDDALASCTVSADHVRAVWKRLHRDDDAEPPAAVVDYVSGRASFVEAAMLDAGLNIISVLLADSLEPGRY